MACGEYGKKLELVAIDEKFREGQVEEAKQELESFLEQTKDNEYAWTLLGHIHAELDDNQAARKAYEQALTINANTVEALTGLGIIFRKALDYPKAADYYHQAIDIDPNYAQAYSSLAVVKLKQRKFDEALKMGLKGYELDPDDPVLIANLSITYHYAGDSLKRDQFYELAEINGYRNLPSLQKIFTGELTVFD